MGYGYGANSAYVVDIDKLKELNLPSFEEFHNSIDREIVQNIGFFYVEELEQDILKLWGQLQQEFQDATGLKLYVGYHDSDAEGSKYDDVDGIFYYAENVITPTLAGSKALNCGLVERKWWVVFT
jgi:hypothetical protein